MSREFNDAAATRAQDAAITPDGAATRRRTLLAVGVWFVVYVAEVAVPGMTTSQLGSTIIASTVLAGLAAWGVWGLCVNAHMARNAWRNKALLPGRVRRTALWGLGIIAALLGVCWLDSAVGPLPPGVSYQAWLGGVLVTVAVGALFLFVAFWIIRIALALFVATHGLALLAALLIWSSFTVGWAPLGWALVVATGVVLGGVVLSALASA